MSDRPQDAVGAVRRALPGVSCLAATRIDGGWDSDSYLVDGEDGSWIVQIGVPGHEDDLRRQIGLLPELRAEVSAPIPELEHTSSEVPAMAYRPIEGRPCSERAGLGLWPERLGRFLYDLHAVPPEFVGLRARSAADIRAEVGAQLDRARAEVLPLLAPRERTGLERRWSAFLGEDSVWRLAPCLVHADLGLEHVLVDDRGDLAGVIDWSDSEVGDPAWDFAVLLHDLPEQGARALAAYGGPPDAGFTARAAFALAFVPVHDVMHGLETGRSELVERGVVGLRERAGR